MAITNPIIDESTYTNTRHHANLDKNDLNMHHPIGFRGASVGSTMTKDGTGNYTYDVLHLPAALGYISSTATPTTEVTGDVYILNADSLEYVVSAINWQSATTVRYTFSGTPDLSGIATSTNILYCVSAVNSEHNGRFVITSVNDGSDYIEVTNTLVTDATLDENTGGLVELPSDELDGASNNDVVKFDGTDWHRITPSIGTKCFDKTLGQFRTFNGTLWLGEKIVHQFAIGDESTAITVATGLISFRNPFGNIYLSEVRASLVGAGSTSGVTTFDINHTTGATCLSSKLTIDYTELTSVTGATPAVISVPNVADDAIITVDCDVVTGGADEVGAKITLIGNYI